MSNETQPPECTLNDPEWSQCCCQCVYRVPTHYHCSFPPARTDKDKGKCGCEKQVGWACVAPELRVYVNWPEHKCGCELFTDKRKENQ